MTVITDKRRDFTKDSFLEDAKLAVENATKREEEPLYNGPCIIDPNGPRIVIKRDKARGPSKIIHAPQKTKAIPTTGTVVAVGFLADPDDPKKNLLEYWLGRRVLFAQFSGTDIRFKGYPSWLILTYEEILGEITKTEAEIDETPLDSMV